MRIGELAKLAGVSTSRIRFYEAQSLLSKAERTANGYRRYGTRDLKIIAFIERAQRLGFALKEIGTFLATQSGKRPSSGVVIGHLEAKLVEIDAHLREVRRRRTEVVGLIRELKQRG